MAFNLIESRLPATKLVLAQYDTFEAALSAAQCLVLVYGEEDDQNPGCWDGFLADGRIVSIEPVGFSTVLIEPYA